MDKGTFHNFNLTSVGLIKALTWYDLIKQLCNENVFHSKQAKYSRSCTNTSLGCKFLSTYQQHALGAWNKGRRIRGHSSNIAINQNEADRTICMIHCLYAHGQTPVSSHPHQVKLFWEGNGINQSILLESLKPC